MALRSYGLVILVLSALVLAYLATGMLNDTPVLLVLAIPGAIGAALLSLVMLIGKG